MVSVTDIFGKFFTKNNLIKVIVGIITLCVAWVYVSTLWTMDTYTAEVTKEMYPAKNGRIFISVKPLEDGFNVDDNGNYKVEIRDVTVPLLAWATRSERMDNLSKGDIICLTDEGVRNGILSWYPNAIKYTDGPCTE